MTTPKRWLACMGQTPRIALGGALMLIGTLLGCSKVEYRPAHPRPPASELTRSGPAGGPRPAAAPAPTAGGKGTSRCAAREISRRPAEGQGWLLGRLRVPVAPQLPFRQKVEQLDRQAMAITCRKGGNAYLPLYRVGAADALNHHEVDELEAEIWLLPEGM